MKSILDNAIDSISLGVEDYQSKDSRRLLSTTRNIYSGLILLLKHKLSVLSIDDDEALIKQKILPVKSSGGIKWEGQGKKTVDYIQIKERCGSLGIVVNWKKLEKLQKYRNNIEHYHIDVQPSTVREYLIDSFVIIREFIRQYLNVEPRDLLGNATWDLMLEEEQVLEAEKKACAEMLDDVVWPNNTAEIWIREGSCPSCGSSLMRPVQPLKDDAEEDEYECFSCGDAWPYNDLLEKLGSPHDTYASIKDGGGSATGICPQCGGDGYDDVESQCALCGESGPYECIRCGTNIVVEELDPDNINLCGWCSHMSNKDD